jgi:hypothetical protein
MIGDVWDDHPVVYWYQPGDQGLGFPLWSRFIWGCPVWCEGPWVAVVLHGRHLRLLLVLIGPLGAA